MPRFAYESRTTSGDQRSGVLEADSRAEAVRVLTGRGEMALSIKQTRSRSSNRATEAKGNLRTRSSRPNLSRAETATFIRELATALEAGLPLMQAMRTIREQATGKGMPFILDFLIERVEAGEQLHQAAQKYGPPFDQMIVGMLRAADASGRASEIMHQLADLLDRSLELRRELLGATFYPLIVAVLILVSIVVLATVLMPRVIAPLAGDMELPWPTKVVLGGSEFVEGYWFLCLAIIGLAIFGWIRWVRIPANRLRLDTFKLRIPLMGKLTRDVAVARFTRTLGTLSAAGLPILEGMHITRDTLGNAALMKAIDDVSEEVTAGKSLASPLEKCGLFPPMLIQVINLGERTGQLERMLLHSANAFDRQVNASLKLFAKALPPVLLIFMAVVAGFVLAAILLPLIELQSLMD